MKITFRLFLAFLLSGCSSHTLLARVKPEATARGYLFSSVNVFDGEQALGPRDVLIRDGKIEAVAEAGTLKAAEGDETIDGAGKTLMPGLVDSHLHMEGAGEAIWDLGLPEPLDVPPAYLYGGTTTGIVMQAGKKQFEMFEKGKSGELASPHLYMTGNRLTAPDGFPVNLVHALVSWPLSAFVSMPVQFATTAAEATAIVDSNFKEFHPAFFKITSDAFPVGTPKLTNEAMVAAIKRSNEVGMRPTAHIGAPDDFMVAAEAGLALFAHPATGGKLSEAQIARLGELKIPFVSTLRAFTGPNGIAADKGSPTERLIVNPKTLAKFSEKPKDFKYPATPEGTDAEKILSEVEDNLRVNLLALRAAGVPFFVGTDSGSPGVIPGAAIHRELRTLVAAGIPPAEVLKAATSAPADFLDKEHSFGRVAPGQRADLLLVTGDPVADISATEAIVDVFLSGRRLVRTLDKP